MLPADRDATMDAPASPTRIHTSVHRESSRRENERGRKRKGGRAEVGARWVRVCNRDKWGLRESEGRKREKDDIDHRENAARDTHSPGMHSRLVHTCGRGKRALVQRCIDAASYIDTDENLRPRLRRRINYCRVVCVPQREIARLSSCVHQGRAIPGTGIWIRDRPLLLHGIRAKHGTYTVWRLWFSQVERRVCASLNPLNGYVSLIPTASLISACWVVSMVSRILSR